MECFEELAALQSLTVSKPYGDGTLSVTDNGALSRFAELINENEGCFIVYFDSLWHFESLETNDLINTDFATEETENSESPDKNEEDKFQEGVIVEAVTTPASPSYTVGETVEGNVSPGSFALYSASLEVIVTDPENVYIFTLTDSNGETVTLALDAVRYGSIAAELEKIIEGSK
jgi:hypothetical protein